MAKNLYVGNLSYFTTEATLTDLFTTVGEVVSVKIITDPETGRSRGFGFVEMASESDGQQAITELNGREVDQRPIKVAEARPRRPRGERDDRRGGRRRW